MIRSRDSRVGRSGPCVIFVLSVLLLCAAPVLANQGEWIEVTGEAAIVEGNEVHSREMALDQALRRAVEMAAGRIVSGVSKTDRFISVKDEITSKSAGYVSRYEIKNTDCGDDTCKVMIRALVSKRALSERLSELGLLVQRRGFPRIIMLIQEQSVEDETRGEGWTTTEARSQVVESTLVRYLNRVLDHENEECAKAPSNGACWSPLAPGMRFTFSDYRSLTASPMVERVRADLELTDDQARRLAGLTDAEVAIVGAAIAESHGSVDEDRRPSYRVDASLSLRILDVASGEILGAVDMEDSSEPTSTPAELGREQLRTLARRAATAIQREIADSWGAEEAGSRSIRMEIEGLGSFNDLREFRGLLETAVTGVRGVTTRSMSGSEASLDLQSTIGSEQLAAELSTRDLGRFSVRVTKMDSSSIGIDLGN